MVQVLRVYNKYLEFNMITDNLYQAGWVWKCAHSLDFIAWGGSWAPTVSPE